MRSHVRTLALVLTTLLAPSLTQAETIVSYLIHENPADPNSSVVFEVQLTLESFETDGNTVGWAVNNATITHHDQAAMISSTWLVTAPNVDTSDGLWWIAHENSASPIPNEFCVVPLISGVAVSTETQSDLNFEISGSNDESPSSYFSYNALLAYRFSIIGVTEPLGEAVDEIVEVFPDEPI